MRHYQKIFALLTFWIFFSAAAFAQTTAFTYQGKLTDGSVPASGVYTMRFDLFAAPTGGTALATQTIPNVSVANGIFTVTLNFGAPGPFDGSDRYLEITVAGTPLTPRQPVTSAPYAIRSSSAGSADTATTAGSATNFTGTLSGDVSGTQGATVVGTVGGQSAANVATATQSINTATSLNTPNTLVKRDANGDFSARIINAATHYNINGSRVLSIAGTNNLFAGMNAGLSNTTGFQNSFFGTNAGVLNTDGFDNSFVGPFAGDSNTTGGFNSFFGTNAGDANTTGSNNSFVGFLTGQSNTTGSNNTMIGNEANVGSGALTFATALGAGAIVNAINTVVLGRPADTVQVPGNLSVTGTFTGSGAGITNLNASNITTGTLTDARLSTNVATLSGAQTFTGAKTFSGGISGNGSGLTNLPVATIADGSITSAKILDGTIVNADIDAAAAIADTKLATISTALKVSNSATTATSANTASAIVARDASGNFSANIINAATQYNIGGNRVLAVSISTSNIFVGVNAGNLTTTGGENSFVGNQAGQANTSGIRNSFVGARAGNSNTTGDHNSFFGYDAGLGNTGGFENSFFGKSAGNLNATGSNNTIIGSNANVGSDALTFATALGAGAVVSTNNTVVLGRTVDTVFVPGLLKVNILGTVGGQPLCRNNADQISICSSSLRYKTNIAPFRFGLSFINQLRPISYNWKNGGMADTGFGAEDVERINPLFVTYNAAGEVEGVKYDRLSTVFVNAFKEQQAQITKQETQIEQQQRQIDELKQIVCALKPDAAVCKETNK